MYLARFLYHNLKGYRLRVALVIVVSFVAVEADVFSALPFKFILDKFTNNINPKFPGADTLIQFFDQFGSRASLAKGEVHTVVGVILFSIVIYIVLGLLSTVLTYVQLYLIALIAKNLTIRLSRQLFDHLQRLSVSWHDKQKPGDLVQRITGNMADLEKFVADGMVNFLTGTLTLVGAITVMFYTSVQFTLLSIIIVPILFVIVLSYTRSIKAAAKKEKKAEGAVSDIGTEGMVKIMEIKAFTLEGFMASVFKRYAGNKFEAGKRVGILQAQFAPIVDILLVIGNTLILGIGAFVAVGNKFPLGFLTIYPSTVTFGTLALFITYLGKLYQPMRDLSKLTALASGASSAAERIQEVLDELPEDLEIPPSYKGARRLTGTISYEDVYFCYNPKSNLILKGITLHIPAGQKIALVGLSGSGKTTLTNLLPRFYETQENWGFIKIDGTSIRDYPLAVLRQNISVVLQDSILFDGTIRENIKIGRPQASDQEVIEAAKQACIHETIMKKPGGYDARITGRDLSGGQRQRIAIARAILRNAPIIIMDEPTAALDAEAEAEVMRALDGLAERGTVLMITHRLNTVGKVDEIIVLGDGRIVEQGTFKNLMKKDGVFAHLWKAQNPLVGEHIQEILDSKESKSIIQSDFVTLPRLSSKAYVLIEMDGKMIGTHQLDKEVLTVGFLPGNDIEIPSRYVSRLHAKILSENGMWVIKDADSLNGLRFQGKHVEQHTFANGDRIYLAPAVSLRYQVMP